MLKYSIDNNTWTEWKTAQNMNLVISAIVGTRNEDYLLFIAPANYDADNIIIYNVRNHTFKESMIKIPCSKKFDAAIVSDEDKEDTLVHGYIREVYKQSGFRNIQKLPHYLIKLIVSWVCFEMLHIIFDKELHYVNLKHFIIDVDKITN